MNTFLIIAVCIFSIAILLGMLICFSVCYFSINPFIGEKFFTTPRGDFKIGEKLEISSFTKKKFENIYLQKIPFNIIQTHLSRNIPTGMHYTMQRNLEMNPEYNHYFFSDEDSRAFIEKHFDKRTLLSYDTLVPGAYKADLFRLCALYILGGIYIDSGMGSIRPIRTFIEENDEIILCSDWDMYILPWVNFYPKKIYNAMIAAIPKHPIIKTNIDIINDNVEKRIYNGLFGITGPVSLLNAANQHPDSKIKWLEHYIIDTSDRFNGVVSEKGKNGRYLFYNRYKHYREEQKLISGGKESYVKCYSRRNVYGEKKNEKKNNLKKPPSIPKLKKVDGFVRDYYNIVPSEQKISTKYIPSVESNKKRILFQNENNPKVCEIIQFLVELNPEFEIITEDGILRSIDKVEEKLQEKKCDIFISSKLKSLVPVRLLQKKQIMKGEKIMFFDKNFSGEESKVESFVMSGE